MPIDSAPEKLFELKNTTIARGGTIVLEGVDLVIQAGDRILLCGENGAGKSSLLLMIAGRLHPFGQRGERHYGWRDAALAVLRKDIAWVSRDEELRLKSVHAKSSVRDFLLGHCDGADFLYRSPNKEDVFRVEQKLQEWELGYIAERKLEQLSCGELRILLLARADLFPRKLYLLDEVLGSLSPGWAQKFYAWFNKLPADAAAILTSHDSNLQKHLAFNRILEIRGGKLYEKVDLPQNAKAPLGSKRNPNPTLLPLDQRELWIRCQEADFCNEFEPVLFGINLELKSGDRILLTGHNGAGKTTLLRALHGEIRPVFGKGEIQFVGVLRHEQRRELWQKIAFVSAAQFDFFPAHMRVAEVLATRLSGSLYDYPESLPQQVEPVLREFSVLELLQRNFRELSEGEKTRVLLARAFLMPAVVYLIDEGFMALSERFFLLALNHLNALPASAAVVIAANERIDIIEQGLLFPLQRWYMAHGRLTTAP